MIANHYVRLHDKNDVMINYARDGIEMNDMILKDTTGCVFNIQHYSIHDGPGIRTTVFLKGCPLRCVWCQNPESQTLDPMLFFNEDKCTGCGRCIDLCPRKAITIESEKTKTDRKLCDGCGRCVDDCPDEARSIMGQTVTASEVFTKVNSDALFYKNSGGGVTISGGDPVAQPRFSKAVLKLCKDAGIHTAIETAGYAKWEALEAILAYVDLILLDFKHMSSVLHKQFTGVPNGLILENARRMYHELHIPILARLPIMPGYNAYPENIGKTAQFIANDLGSDVKVHLIPYHRLGETKYMRMEAPEKIVSIEPPREEEMARLLGVVQSYGLSAVVGG